MKRFFKNIILFFIMAMCDFAHNAISNHAVTPFNDDKAIQTAAILPSLPARASIPKKIRTLPTPGQGDYVHIPRSLERFVDQNNDHIPAAPTVFEPSAQSKLPLAQSSRFGVSGSSDVGRPVHSGLSTGGSHPSYQQHDNYRQNIIPAQQRAHQRPSSQSFQKSIHPVEPVEVHPFVNQPIVSRPVNVGHYPAPINSGAEPVAAIDPAAPVAAPAKSSLFKNIAHVASAIPAAYGFYRVASAANAIEDSAVCLDNVQSAVMLPEPVVDLEPVSGTSILAEQCRLLVDAPGHSSENVQTPEPTTTTNLSQIPAIEAMALDLIAPAVTAKPVAWTKGASVSSVSPLYQQLAQWYYRAQSLMALPATASTGDLIEEGTLETPVKITQNSPKVQDSIVLTGNNGWGLKALAAITKIAPYVLVGCIAHRVIGQEAAQQQKAIDVAVSAIAQKATDGLKHNLDVSSENSLLAPAQPSIGSAAWLHACAAQIALSFKGMRLIP